MTLQKCVGLSLRKTQIELVGSFVDNDYNIIWMADSFPILPLRYDEYIEKLNTAVQARNFELIQIVKLTEMPEIKEKAAKWFHEKWGVPLEAYLESMEAALNEILSRSGIYVWMGIKSLLEQESLRMTSMTEKT